MRPNGDLDGWIVNRVIHFLDLISMAKTDFNALSLWRGRVGGLGYKVVDGKQVVTPYTGAAFNPRTEAQMMHRAKFGLAGMISKIVPAEVLVGMSDQRSRRRPLFFSNIVQHATATVTASGITASLDAEKIVFSQGAAAPVTASGVLASGGVVSGTVVDLPEKVDAVMVVGVVFDTRLGIYTHTVYAVLPADDTAFNLDTSEASSGDVVHLYCVPLSLPGSGISYTRSADGAERNDADGFALTMLLRSNDGSYRYGRSQYLTTINLGTGATSSAGSSSGSGGNGSNSGNGSGTSSGGQTTTVSAPTISGSTPFAESTTVSMSAESGAEIRYTTNGTTPTASSTLYSAPLTLTATTTVKAIALKNGLNSSVATKVFTKSDGGNDDPDTE